MEISTSTLYTGRGIAMSDFTVKCALLISQLVSMLVLMITLSHDHSHAANIILPNSALFPSSSKVWKSPNGAFSMGFFSFAPDTHYYVGIWYSSLPLNKSVVWTANRDQSVPTNSTLLFTHDGRLQLVASLSPQFPHRNVSIWEASTSVGAVSNASRAELTDSGNFALTDDTSRILWQTFDHPTDTLLPNQNFSFSLNLTLLSWTSAIDPSSSSKYSLTFGRIAGPYGRIRLLYQGTSEYWSEPPSGVNTALFNTTISIDAGGTISLYNGDGSLIWVNKSCDYGIPNSRTKLQLNVDGNLRVLTWTNASGKWDTQWRALYLQCDVFGTCGDNSICDKNENILSASGGVCPLIEPPLEQVLCSCPEGYTQNSSEYCVPPSALNCSHNMSSMEHTSFGVPGEKAEYSPITQTDCVGRCLNDCSCTAASYSNLSSECWLYQASLFNGVRSSDSSETSFVKTVASNLTSGASSRGNPLPSYAIVLIVVAASLILLLLTVAGLVMRHQMRSKYPSFNEVFLDPSTLDTGGPKRFSFDDLYMVTSGFSEENKLGAGGFGSVYKGTFTTPVGKRDVAIKRLHTLRHQALLRMEPGKEHSDYLAEIEALGSIKHANVVNLMGFCAEGPERLLVYEYVPNGSLSDHILNRSSILSWNRRFQIAVGAALGIEYLHTHCPKKIVHRDIKPDNILLDEDFKAKVADFGVSQIMGPDRTHLTNNTLRGTPTYMAPECLQAGAMITEKADAYSYGLVLLELLSGRMVMKRHFEREQGGGEGINAQDNGSMRDDAGRRRRIVYLEHARQAMETDSWETLVDERLEGVYKRDEAEMLIKVVFWCLQGNPDHRPAMEELLLMIKGHKPVSQPPLLSLFDQYPARQHLGSPQSSTIMVAEQVSQGR